MTGSFRPFIVLPLLIIAACAPLAPAQEAPRPWLEAGDARPVTTAAGRTDPQIRGVWESRGYGRILDIGDHGVIPKRIDQNP